MEAIDLVSISSSAGSFFFSSRRWIGWWRPVSFYSLLYYNTFFFIRCWMLYRNEKSLSYLDQIRSLF